jgi:hypothetical protein
LCCYNISTFDKKDKDYLELYRTLEFDDEIVSNVLKIQQFTLLSLRGTTKVPGSFHLFDADMNTIQIVKLPKKIPIWSNAVSNQVAYFGSKNFVFQYDFTALKWIENARLPSDILYIDPSTSGNYYGSRNGGIYHNKHQIAHLDSCLISLTTKSSLIYSSTFDYLYIHDKRFMKRPLLKHHSKMARWKKCGEVMVSVCKTCEVWQSDFRKYELDQGLDVIGQDYFMLSLDRNERQLHYYTLL